MSQFEIRRHSGRGHVALAVACGILPVARSSSGHTTPLPARSPSPSTPRTDFAIHWVAAASGRPPLTSARRILIIRAPQKGRLYGSCDTEAVHGSASAYRPASPPHAECIASVLYGGSTPLRLWQQLCTDRLSRSAGYAAWPTSSRCRRCSIGRRLGKGWSRPRITLIAACDLAAIGVFQDGSRIGMLHDLHECVGALIAGR